MIVLLVWVSDEGTAIGPDLPPSLRRLAEDSWRMHDAGCGMGRRARSVLPYVPLMRTLLSRQWAAALMVAAAMLVSLVTASPASAERRSARKVYDEATVAFGLGHYADAAAKYEEAFSLKPDPALLYNAAQSYRLAGNKPRALELYRNCLRLFPDFPNASDARNRVAELKKELEEAPAATRPPAATSPPAATVPPPSATTMTTAVTPPPAAPPPAPPPPAAPPPALVATAPGDAGGKDEPRGGSKTWLWITVGAVAVAGGVAAIVLATRGTSYPDANFGTTNGN